MFTVIKLKKPKFSKFSVNNAREIRLVLHIKVNGIIIVAKKSCMQHKVNALI